MCWLQIGTDISKEMIEYAKKTYKYFKVDFRVMDIGNANDCNAYSFSFDKIFSFFCFQMVPNIPDALHNTHLMLKSGGEVLINFLLILPMVELYKIMDLEWKKYIDVSTKIVDYSIGGNIFSYIFVIELNKSLFYTYIFLIKIYFIYLFI